jgi:hypothetical protein
MKERKRYTYQCCVVCIVTMVVELNEEKTGEWRREEEEVRRKWRRNK